MFALGTIMNQDEPEFMPPENDQLIEGLSELDELRKRGLDSSRQMPTIHHLMDELDGYVRILQEGEPSRGLEIIREPECERAVRLLHHRAARVCRARAQTRAARERRLHALDLRRRIQQTRRI